MLARIPNGADIIFKDLSMSILRPFVLILICLTCITDCYAQLKSQNKASSEIRIFGTIVNEDDAEGVPYVHIRNIHTGKGTISDLTGEFLIPVNPEDTLIFTAVGYEDYFFTLSNAEITADSYALTIVLNPSTLELSPVSIFAFKSESDFKKEILNLKIEDAKKEILIPGAFYGTPEPATTKLYVMDMGLTCEGCITSLVNLFRRKSEEKRLANEKILLPRQQEIYKKYNPEVVSRITGLDGDILNEFLLFCKIKDEFILEANEYEIFLAVNDCFKSFINVQSD